MDEAEFDNRSFRETLSSFSVPQQRQVGVRFIEQVLDLCEAPRLGDAVRIMRNGGGAAEELDLVNRTARAVYVETSPHSDMAELDFARQAAHFVAEACRVCTSPVYPEARHTHLAQKVAMLCLMARTCASIGYDQQEADFSAAEWATTQLMHEQYAVLASYLQETR